MEKELLEKIERNTKRTANNTAFITWTVIILSFCGGLLVAMQF